MQVISMGRRIVVPGGGAEKEDGSGRQGAEERAQASCSALESDARQARKRGWHSVPPAPEVRTRRFRLFGRFPRSRPAGHMPVREVRVEDARRSAGHRSHITGCRAEAVACSLGFPRPEAPGQPVRPEDAGNLGTVWPEKLSVNIAPGGVKVVAFPMNDTNGH